MLWHMLSYEFYHRDTVNKFIVITLKTTWKLYGQLIDPQLATKPGSITRALCRYLILFCNSEKDNKCQIREVHRNMLPFNESVVDPILSQNCS